MKPFLKWAGGKTQLLPVLENNLYTQNIEDTVYIEPFIGAGAFFLYIAEKYKFKQFIISDINHRLINVYQQIKFNLKALLASLDKLCESYNRLKTLEHKQAYYYELRVQFNQLNQNTDLLTEACLFIFLNKSCFNGIYRENSKGGFNVPFGKKHTVKAYDLAEITKISAFLNSKNQSNEDRVIILSGDYSMVPSYLTQNNHYFIYLDPPYRPVTEGGFSQYHSSSFNDEHQKNLADFIKEHLNAPHIKWLLSNSDPYVLDEMDTFFDKMYQEFNIERVSAKRMVNCDATKRGAITELLIKNY